MTGDPVGQQLADQDLLPDGAVTLQLSFTVGPRRNWANLWKPTIDALGRLLGRSDPGRPWHVHDGRIVELGMHCKVDAALGNDVVIAIATSSFDKTADLPRTQAQSRAALAAALQRHDCVVRGENEWQKRARLLQSLWRTRAGCAAGDHQGRPLGSRLLLADGEPPKLRNYLTDAAGRQVVAAVQGVKQTKALISTPRIWVDLLSSQPLCFNLFGDMAEDLDLATSTLRMVWPEIQRVEQIRFEYSPGLADPRYLGTKSAFDVFVEYTRADGRAFLGIEVKYHEDLKVKAANDPTGRFPEIAKGTAAFRADALERLATPPLQQLWLDHLLALRLRDVDQWAAGKFVLLYPLANHRCRQAATDYRVCLTDCGDFDAVTLEELVAALRYTSDADWVEEFYDRYLNPAVLTAAGVPPLGASKVQPASQS